MIHSSKQVETQCFLGWWKAWWLFLDDCSARCKLQRHIWKSSNFSSERLDQLLVSKMYCLCAFPSPSGEKSLQLKPRKKPPEPNLIFSITSLTGTCPTGSCSRGSFCCLIARSRRGKFLVPIWPPKKNEGRKYKYTCCRSSCLRVGWACSFFRELNPLAWMNELL